LLFCYFVIYASEEKRSSEVWDLPLAGKAEFGQFGDVLAKTKKTLIKATNVTDTSEVLTRVIERKLRDEQELTSKESTRLMNDIQEVDFEIEP